MVSDPSKRPSATPVLYNRNFVHKIDLTSKTKHSLSEQTNKKHVKTQRKLAKLDQKGSEDSAKNQEKRLRKTKKLSQKMSSQWQQDFIDNTEKESKMQEKIQGTQQQLDKIQAAMLNQLHINAMAKVQKEAAEAQASLDREQKRLQHRTEAHEKVAEEQAEKHRQEERAKAQEQAKKGEQKLKWMRKNELVQKKEQSNKQSVMEAEEKQAQKALAVENQLHNREVATLNQVEEQAKKRDKAQEMTAKNTYSKALAKQASQEAALKASLEQANKNVHEQDAKQLAEFHVKDSKRREQEAQQEKEVEVQAKAEQDEKAKKQSAEGPAQAAIAQQEKQQHEKQLHEDWSLAIPQKKAEERQQQDKFAHEHAKGKWCGCVNPFPIDWHTPGWKLCPNGMLLTAMHRGAEQFLRSIDQYKCCRPCKDDGHTVMPLGGCVDANWWGSFDSQGWSNCPDNTYIQGFYKNSCDWLYCLEMAKCCPIQGSKGRGDCGGQNWWSSFDSPGFSDLSPDNFMTGLYRTSGHYLYNLESPMQCTFYANA